MGISVVELEPMLRHIVKAVEKATGEDIREYLASGKKATNNAVRFMRADNINTNLRNSVVSETLELKIFKRFSWMGSLLIDRQHRLTVSICSIQTLENIRKKPNRCIPHYLQTILNIQNATVEPQYEQVSLFDGKPENSRIFSEDEYRRDYESIMGDDLSFDDGYQHLIVVYEISHMIITSISMRILDKNFQIAQVFELDYMLKPDFGELTVEDNQVKDAHSLVSVKPKVKKASDNIQKKEIRVVAKIMEGEKQA